jgi:undecaprenyl-diphosphatase
MQSWQAALLGLVEGLTEFLPVSSTGHLVLTSHALGLRDQSGAFEVVIQAGAILAVIWHYRHQFLSRVLGALRLRREALTFWSLILVGVLPAITLALLFGKWIKANLFGPWPVTAALILGGIAMILIERRLPAKASPDILHGDSEGDENRASGKDFPSSYREALIIGLAQCCALWPGTSRSMATILGARMLGFSPKGAAEFSFWLAIPTLLGASAYDFLKHREELTSSPEMLLSLGIGLLVSFVSGLVVIRVFLRFLQKNSLEVFGWYRIVFGLALAAFWLR